MASSQDDGISTSSTTSSPPSLLSTPTTSSVPESRSLTTVVAPTALDGAVLSEPTLSTGDMANEKGMTKPPIVNSSGIIPARRVMVPRANCTHTTMDLLYGEDTPCDFCGRKSRLGWLYHCKQDVVNQTAAHHQLHQLVDIIVTQDMSGLEELEAIGMSQSVIDQVKRGDVYLPWQIEMLKSQKLHLQKTIESQLELDVEPQRPHPKIILLPDGTSDTARSTPPTDGSSGALHPNITMRTSARQATLSKVYKIGKLRRRPPDMSKCNLKSCQTCRPYFRDRAYMSFGSVFADEILPLTSIKGLPIADVAVVRRLGLRPAKGSSARSDSLEESSSFDSSCTSSTGSGSGQDPAYETLCGVESSPLNQLPTLPNSVAFGSAHSLQGAGPPHNTSIPTLESSRRQVSNNSGTPEISDASSADATLIQPMVASLQRSDIQFGLGDEKTDLGLHMTTTKTEANHHRSASADDAKETVGKEQACTRRYSVAAVEVPVEGGVALTEEAVETHTPDIITLVRLEEGMALPEKTIDMLDIMSQV